MLGDLTQPMVAAQIMQLTSRLKAEIDVVRASIAKHITRDMEDFGTADAVLDHHPDARNRLIGRFLFRHQRTYGRSLLGLIGAHVGRFVALKPSVLVRLAVRWEVILLLIGGALVADLAWSRATQRLNLASSALRDDHVLDSMALELAAVELTLACLIPWALHWSLGAIDDEFQPWTLPQHLGQCWQLFALGGGARASRPG